MKRHHNTLYVITQGSYLSKDGETVMIRVDDQSKTRLPIHNLEGIVCFGNVMCSPFLLGLCGERGVHVSFLTESGHFLARVEGPTSGNVLLRREQYRRAEALDASAEIARVIALAKIANSRSLILRAVRDHPDAPGLERLQEASRVLSRYMTDAQRSTDLDSLRGIEGMAAREYFGCFSSLILHQREFFPFTGRNRRPPLDRVNALLSFLYTLVLHDVTGALEGVGLDPQVGFLHRDRPGRPGLALDLMEESRAFVADRLTFSLINRRQLGPDDFVVEASGAVLLTKAARKTVLTAYQQRKADCFTHPFLGETTTIGLLPHLQALLLSRFLRGDLDGYPAFIAR